MTGERRKIRSTWWAVVGLALLAIPGFALGIAAGIAWEAPGLLASHLLGGTEEVAWGVSGDAPLPAVAAPSPAEPEPRAEPAQAPSELASRRVEPPAPPRPPAAADAGRFSVQVGAFSESAAAERLADTLRSRGYPVYLSPGTGSRSARWRVRVGPYGSRGEAERTAGRLKGEEELPTWVLDENAA